MNNTNLSYIPQAHKMKLYVFMYRQQRPVTTRVKNTLEHFNVITVVKCI